MFMGITSGQNDNYEKLSTSDIAITSNTSLENHLINKMVSEFVSIGPLILIKEHTAKITRCDAFLLVLIKLPHRHYSVYFFLDALVS